jgi:7-cyano-7-deazaguanine synthase
MHLLSGGLDSTVLLYDLIGQGCKVHCVLFDYQQRHVQELTFAKLHCHRLSVLFTTITLQQLRGSTLTDGTGGVIVENRNAILLSHAAHLAAVAGAELVTYAANKDDEEVFPDCRQSFVEAFNKMLDAAGVRVHVAAPYLSRSKAWIAGLGREIGVALNDTWSCYEGGEAPCGKCPACVKRNEALK